LELEKDFQLHKKRKNQKYNAGNKGVDAVSEIKGGVGGETLMAAATSHNSAAENTDLLALANDTQRSFIKTATLSPARPNGDPINNCDGEMKESDDRSTQNIQIAIAAGHTIFAPWCKALRSRPFRTDNKTALLVVAPFLKFRKILKKRILQLEVCQHNTSPSCHPIDGHSRRVFFTTSDGPTEIQSQN